MRVSRGIATFIPLLVAALQLGGCASAPRKQRWAPGSAAEPSAQPRVPYLGEDGQQAYREYLWLPLPRAFAVSASGRYAMASGTVTGDLDRPTDPKIRALDECRRRAGAVCWLYSIDESVVLSESPPPGAGVQ